jgi:hypothetical protein
VIDRKQPFDTYDGPREGEPEEHSTFFAPHGVLFVRNGRPVGTVDTRSKAQASLLTLLARSGVRGLVRVPHTPEESARVMRRYQELLDTRDERIRRLIAERTNDPELHDKVLAMLQARLLAPH